eukprot:gene9933-6946_t
MPWRVGVAPETLSTAQVSTFPFYVAKYLYRLRVSVDPGIGGWEAGTHTPTACPWCRIPLTRPTAVPHFLSCPATRSLRTGVGLPATASEYHAIPRKLPCSTSRALITWRLYPFSHLSLELLRM